jgi:hypothetical protein
MRGMITGKNPDSAPLGELADNSVKRVNIGFVVSRECRIGGVCVGGRGVTSKCRRGGSYTPLDHH